MLEFASLFLGLIWGLQPVELVVGDANIVGLELRLDGEPAGRLTQPPWKMEVDFGDLAQHRLEVFGLNAGGVRIARAEQWINVPRPAAEARLVIENDEAGNKKLAVLKWESVSGKPPVHLELRFDGELLAGELLEEADVAAPERFRLPAGADPDQLHFLTAVLVFPDGSTAHAEASFGGLFGDQVETELTAFPVRVLKKEPSLDSLSACLSGADGVPLKVAQVERGAAEVLFVRDKGAETLLRRLRDQGSVVPMPALRGVRQRSMRNAEFMRFEMKLKPEDRVRFVWPNVIEGDHPHFKNTGLFESSPFVTAKDGGLFHFLTRLYPENTGGGQHLADAIALAGLRASAEGRRRAVVLVMGDRAPQEQSTQTPAAVQGFLKTLQVPLHVWSGAGDGKSSPAWPPALIIASPEWVKKAVRALEKDLNSQRIVWIAGRYLASEIRLDRELCPDFAPLFPPRPPKAAGSP